MIYVVGYFIIINILGFFLMAIDKKRARKEKWRIPERRFWFVGLLGGGIGLYLGMQMFHHKTKHNSFKYGMPVVIVVNILSYGYLYLQLF